MTSRATTLAALLAAALTLPLTVPLIVPAPAAAAPAGCGQAITDDAGLLGPDLSALRRDVSALGHDGATVRVRTYRVLPAGGMDAAERSTEQACPSWRSDGRRATHLIVLTVSAQDRKTGLYYGSAYTDALDGQWASIERSQMNGPFRSGHYAQGLDAAVRAVNKRISGTHTTTGSAVAAFAVSGAAVLITLAIAVVARRNRRGPGGGGGRRGLLGGGSAAGVIGGTSAATAGSAGSAGGGGSTSF